MKTKHVKQTCHNCNKRVSKWNLSYIIHGFPVIMGNMIVCLKCKKDGVELPMELQQIGGSYDTKWTKLEDEE